MDYALGRCLGVPDSEKKLVVVVHPGNRTGTVLSWLRMLLPAALLLVWPVPPPTGADVLEIDSDECPSGLSLADALAKARDRK